MFHRIHFSVLLMGCVIGLCGTIHSLPLFDNIPLADEFTVLRADYDHDDITVYKFLEEQKNSYIVFIKDVNGNHYVVKQERDRTLKNQFRALCEVLCARIASEIAIPSHHVRLLPVGVSFPGKFIVKRVATLHTLVPGKTIRTLVEGHYAKLDIKQATDTNVPVEKQGFTERTIFYMSLHPQLPYIVALDTFTGNKDRNKANILYDEETDSFYAIDMSLMHDATQEKQSVVQIACQQVYNMIDRHKKYTDKELQALSQYRLVLQDLVKKFPPKKTCELFDAILMESGLLSQQSGYDEKEINALLSLYKRAIKESYVDVKKLIYLLYILINN